METLEKRARQEYSDLCLQLGTYEDANASMRELVALGFLTGTDVLWYELENTAERNPDGRGEFYVDGMAVSAVMNQAFMQLGGVWDSVVLWHTHVNTVQPSAEDVAEFPDWLADAGAIYHVPTGTTTLYNRGGIIPVSLPDTSTIATPE
jgi:hypothetical protein